MRCSDQKQNVGHISHIVKKYTGINFSWGTTYKGIYNAMVDITKYNNKSNQKKVYYSELNYNGDCSNLSKLDKPFLIRKNDITK